jgi:CheY-like chemotaxis protein
MARILVIDDEEAILELLAGLLGADGHDVAVATGGVDALARAPGLQPQLVITDMIMPGLDGIGTIPHLIALDPRPRIVAISGGARHGELDVLTEAERLGADAVMEKPLDLMALRSLVERLVA